MVIIVKYELIVIELINVFNVIMVIVVSYISYLRKLDDLFKLLIFSIDTNTKLQSLKSTSTNGI
jgi:hypothetical protein